ncbi:6-bladed beta-propeller [Roseivirga sp.]|uniref:6-bladed beta-propeller n=1 Tax=Roseivirga sp. TaxID=1964215 RepID=UPI003B52F94F
MNCTHKALKRCTLLLVFCLSLGCQSEKKPQNSIHRIEIDPGSNTRPLQLSSISDSLEYIHLQSGNYSFIGSIAHVEEFNGKYYVHDKDQDAIVIFDRKGKYIDRVQRIGDGPGEYRKIDFFDLNKKNSSLEIYDVRKGKVFTYDLYGNFVSSIRVTLICRDFITTPDGDYLFYSPDEYNFFNGTKELGTGLIHVSRNGKEANLILPLGDEKFSPILVSSSLVEYQKNTYLFSNYTDTVYQIKESEVTNKYFVDYGTQIDERALLDPNFTFVNADFAFLKLNPLVTENTISYSFLYKGEDKTTLIDKTSLKSSLFRGTINDIDSGMFTLNGTMINDSDYVSFFTSEMANAYQQYYSSIDISSTQPDSSNYRISQIIDEMKLNNNNPVIIRTKMKAK